MSSGLNLSTAQGAMKLVQGRSYAAVLDALGVSKEEMALVTGDSVWIGADRSSVRRVLDNLAAGVMDLVGVGRFEMPAEYIAAVIVNFVAPVNVMLACRWYESARSSEHLQGASTVGADVVRPERLFALCCELYGGDPEYGNKFGKQVAAAVGKVVK